VRLYLDASALVKNYLIEAGSSDVVAATAAALSVGTSIIGYAEVRAAFARALREARLDAASHSACVSLLDAHWPRYAVVESDGPCVRDAARLVDQYSRHALRAFDAVHLASAVVIAAGLPARITFGCWDQRLWRAARDEGFIMLPPTEPA